MGLTSLVFDKSYFDGTNTHSGYAQRPYPSEHVKLEIAATAEVLLRLFAPTDVLDVGCATGLFVDAMHSAGVYACGVDISSWAVSTGRGKGTSSLVQADATLALPFRSEYADLVNTSGMLECVLDPVAALDEMRRVLRPGGTLVLKTAGRRHRPDDDRPGARPEAWWLEVLKEKGFDHLPGESHELRRRILRACAESVVAHPATLRAALGRTLYRFGEVGKDLAIKLRTDNDYVILIARRR